MISKIYKFLDYWYLRYMLVTELYMVEPWERVTIHVLLLLMFLGFWHFNYTVLLSGLSRFVGFSKMTDYTDVNIPQTT